MSQRPAEIEIKPSGSGHIGIAVRALIAAGWVPNQAPENGKLSRNRQLIRVQTGERAVSLRFLVYKITRSSRGRPHERRIEITSTYGHGIERVRGVDDVVLGFDYEAGVFVGLDPVRLRHGGETSNASSFLEQGGLRRSADVPFVILLRQTRIFPEGEYQAFFRPECLGEYILNYEAIHEGVYGVQGVGDMAGLPKGWTKASIGSVGSASAHGNTLVLTRERGRSRRAGRLTNKALKLIDEVPRRRSRLVSPEELRAIHQRQEQNGLLGEQFVFEREKTVLRDAGHAGLAKRVDWISKRSVGEGYDIASFDPRTGAPTFIEVKSSEGEPLSFDTSANEWARAGEMGVDYFIYRVMKVREVPKLSVLQNPVQLHKEGKLQLSTSNWRVKVLSGR